jgi:hypothetical protein
MRESLISGWTLSGGVWPQTGQVSKRPADDLGCRGLISSRNIEDRQSLAAETDFIQQTPDPLDPLPCPEAALQVTTHRLRTDQDYDCISSGLKGTQQENILHHSRARQFNNAQLDLLVVQRQGSCIVYGVDAVKQRYFGLEILIHVPSPWPCLKVGRLGADGHTPLVAALRHAALIAYTRGKIQVGTSLVRSSRTNSGLRNSARGGIFRGELKAAAGLLPRNKKPPSTLVNFGVEVLVLRKAVGFDGVLVL